MLRPTIAALVCAVALQGAAQAQNNPVRQPDTDYRGQVTRYLQDQATKHLSEGFTRDSSIEDFVAPLRLEGGVIWPVRLRRGVTYRVFAVCDNDCSDVDLELYDASGAFVGRDISVNDQPFVEIVPSQDGIVYARIWLAACESEPCYVGGRVYRR